MTDQSKKHILIVDDAEFNLYLLSEFLQNKGYVCHTAENALQAFDIIKKNFFNLIISDIQMPPGPDGIQMMKEIKKDYPSTDFIIMTAHSKDYGYKDIISAGANDYILKPIDILELEAKIARIDRENSILEKIKEISEKEKKIAVIAAEAEVELRKAIELRKVNEELNKVQEQLFQKSKLASLGEMATGIAHEINQPLNGIALIAKLFQKYIEKKILNENLLKEGIDDINLQIERISKIINHIRMFARQDLFNLTYFDVNQTIKASLSLMGEPLRLDNIEVLLELCTDLPSIKGDPYQLEQVWMNVLSNARDAVNSKEKQILNKVLQIDNFQKVITISTYYHSNCIKIFFKDNGIGMSDKTRDKIFEPFFTTKEVGSGTGLGMSISYGIIKNHDGQIQVETEEFKGTTIIFTIPV